MHLHIQKKKLTENIEKTLKKHWKNIEKHWLTVLAIQVNKKHRKNIGWKINKLKTLK